MSWRAWSCSSSCTVPIRSVAESRTIGVLDLTAADRGALPEHRWGPDAFLAAACRKAGLAPEAWREPETHVLTLQTDVFGEAMPWDEGRGTREGGYRAL